MSEISEPRDQEAIMQSDWHNVLCTLRMLQDRALTGTPLHVRRPSWLSPTADPVPLLREGAKRMIDDLFSTAVVDDA